jgi:hypothetical protein
MVSPCRGCADRRDRRPLIRGWTETRAGVEGLVGTASPDDHLLAGPDRAMIDAWGWCSKCRKRCPGVVLRSVASTVAQVRRLAVPTPDEHFRAGPDGRVRGSATWGVDGRRMAPCPRSHIVTNAYVLHHAVASTAPRDQAGTSPDERAAMVKVALTIDSWQARPIVL